jgi:hypothetical protein
MIRVQNSVPNVYYDSSRDFQLIGHLFDLVLNATKTDADLLFNLPFSINSDDQLLDLMAYTLGLRLSKEKYTSAQLRSICSVAFKMMRAKGSLESINLLCTALIRADSVAGSFKAEYNPNTVELTVYTTNMTTCKEILREILPYIVPAGIVFNIKEMSVFNTQASTNTEVNMQNVGYGILKYTNELQVPQNTVGKTKDSPGTLSNMAGNKYAPTDDKEDGLTVYTSTYSGDLANLIISDD